MEPFDSCKQAPGVIEPVVSLTRCEGKGDCVKVCPENVFRVRRIEQDDYRTLNAFHKLKLRVHGMQVAYTPNADACRSCGLCVSACPEHAITLKRRDYAINGAEPAVPPERASETLISRPPPRACPPP
jgi:4Fe-4S ferredoxin